MDDPRDALNALYQQQLGIMNSMRRMLAELPDDAPGKDRFVRIVRQMQTQVDTFCSEKESIAADYAMALSEALQRDLDRPRGPGPNPDAGQSS